MSESVDENITETYKELIRMYENEVIRMRGIIDHQEKEFVFIYIYMSDERYHIGLEIIL